MERGRAWRRVVRAVELAVVALLVLGAVPAARSQEEAPPADEGRWKLNWEGLLRVEAAVRLEGPRTLSKERNLIRLRGRLQGPGSFAAALGVRAFYDAAYDLSDRYPEEVEEDLESEGALREAYVEWSGEELSVRIGKQQVVWGEAFGRFLTDVVVPKDLSEFLLPDFEYLRIPLWLGSLGWSRGDVSIQAVVAPDLAYSVLPPAGAEFAPTAGAPQGAVIVEPARRPPQTLSNTEYGGRLSWLRRGWDFSALFWRGFEDLPIPFASTGVDPLSGGPALVVSPGPHRFTTLGGTISKSRGRAVYRGEAAYERGRLLRALDPADADGVVEADTAGLIAGADVSLPGRALLSVQVLHQEVLGSSRGLQGPPGRSALMLRAASADVAGRWSARFEAHLGRERDSMLRPRIAYAFPNAMELAAGVDLFGGPADSFYGQFAGRDRLYVELSYFLPPSSSGARPGISAAAGWLPAAGAIDASDP